MTMPALPPAPPPATTPYAGIPSALSLPAPVGAENFALSNGLLPSDEPHYVDVDAIDTRGLGGFSKEKQLKFHNEFRGLISQSILDLKPTLWEETSESRRLFLADDSENEAHFDGGCTIEPSDLQLQIKTVSARRARALTSARQWFLMEPRVPEIERDAARAAADFGQKVFLSPDGLDIRSRLTNLDRQAAVDGFVLVHTAWRHTHEKFVTWARLNEAVLDKLGIPKAERPISPMDGQVVQIKGKPYLWGQRYRFTFDKVKHNCFTFKEVPAHDVILFPPSAENLEDAAFLGHAYEMNRQDALANVASGYFDKKAVIEIFGEDTSYGKGHPSSLGVDGPRLSKYAQPIDESRPTGTTSERLSPDFENKLMVHLVGKLIDVDGDGLREEVMVDMEWSTGIIVRAILSPYAQRPYVIYRHEPRLDGGPFGWSMAQQLKAIQQELSMRVRQGIDAGTQALIKVVEIDGAMGEDDAELTPGINYRRASRDGKIINIHELTDVPNSNLADIGQMRRQMERIGGADETAQGVTPSKETTLGQTNLAATSGNIRLTPSLIEASKGLSGIVNRFYEYCRHHLETTSDREYITNGKSWAGDYTIDDLAVTEFATIQWYCEDIDPDAAFRFQIAEKWFTLLAQSPFVQQHPDRLWQVIQDFLDDTGYHRNIQQRIGTKQEAVQPPPIPPELLAQLNPNAQGQPGQAPGTIVPGQGGQA